MFTTGCQNEWALLFIQARKLAFLAINHFVNLTFFPMYFLGLIGMPRRIPDYNIQFTDLNMLATLGAMIFGISQLIFVWIIIENAFLKKGKKATSKVWDAPNGLEWVVPSPAPHHTFMTPPDKLPRQ